MRVPFGNGSWTQTERSNWEFWYPYPPFHATYSNEPGLHVHLSPADANNVVNAVSGAAGAIGGAVGGILGALGGVLPNVLGSLLRNADGSMDIHVAPHGFVVGRAPAADPNHWIGPLWGPVANALWQLNRVPLRAPGMDALSIEGMEEAKEVKGRLVSTTPMTG